MLGEHFINLSRKAETDVRERKLELEMVPLSKVGLMRGGFDRQKRKRE